MLLFTETIESDDKDLAHPAILLMSEITIADTEVPAAIVFPVGGNSNKALADFKFKSLLLTC